jgi:hypothetical protein
MLLPLADRSSNDLLSRGQTPKNSEAPAEIVPGVCSARGLASYKVSLYIRKTSLCGLRGMDSNSADIEWRARAAEQTAITNSNNNKESLEAIIKSTELYFQALRVTENGQDKKRLQTKVKALLAQAERLRAAQDGAPALKKQLVAPTSTRKLTTRENIILLEGAKLNGFIFRPWSSAPAPEEFSLREGEPMFTDSMTLPLSAEQHESFDGWKRPREALPSVYTDAGVGPSERQATVMHLPVAMDLVQDMTSDCSVVASLCALTSRVQRGFPKVWEEPFRALPS